MGEFAALAYTLAPDAKGLAKLREKPGFMMIYHRMMGAGGHRRLQKLSYWRSISALCRLSTNDIAFRFT
jgi:hypothetical protein